MKTILVCLILYLVCFELSAQTLPSSSFSKANWFERFGVSEEHTFPADNQFQVVGENPDSAYSWTFENNQRKIVYRYLYTYNSQNQITQVIQFSRENNQWVRTYQESTEYDNENRRNRVLIQFENEGVLENFGQLLWTYNGHSSPETSIIQNWTGEDWENASMETYSYDSNLRKSTTVSSVWSGEWVNSGKQIFNYDGSGKLVSRLEQVWESDWIDSRLESYTYTPEGLSDISLIQSWITGEWVDAERNVYEYDSNLKLYRHTYQLFNDAEWEDFFRFIYSYDPAGNLTNTIIQDFISDEWVNAGQVMEGYNDEGNRDYYVFSEWKDEWIRLDSIKYYYGAATGIFSAHQSPGFTITPNPAYSDIQIHVEKGFFTQGTLAIYDIKGTKMMEHADIDEITHLDVSTLLPGVYHVVLSNDRRLYSQQFLRL